MVQQVGSRYIPEPMTPRQLEAQSCIGHAQRRSAAGSVTAIVMQQVVQDVNELGVLQRCCNMSI